MAGRSESVALAVAVGFGSAAGLLVPSVGYIAVNDGIWVARGVMFVLLAAAWCGVSAFLAARQRRRS